MSLFYLHSSDSLAGHKCLSLLRIIKILFSFLLACEKKNLFLVWLFPLQITFAFHLKTAFFFFLFISEIIIICSIHVMCSHFSIWKHIHLENSVFQVFFLCHCLHFLHWKLSFAFENMLTLLVVSLNFFLVQF